MKNLILLFSTLLLCSIITNCNKIIFREIDCDDFELTEEYYWPSESVGQQLIFDNETGDSLIYTVRDRTIEHRTMYKTDTGCSCLDESRILLTSSRDSLWFKVQTFYQEDNDPERVEDIVFTFSGTQSIFYETSRTNIDSQTIDNLVVEDVKKFEVDRSFDNAVREVYSAKDLGIIQFIKTDGTIWTNRNLTNSVAIDQSDFSYSENTCE